MKTSNWDVTSSGFERQIKLPQNSWAKNDFALLQVYQCSDGLYKWRVMVDGENKSAVVIDKGVHLDHAMKCAEYEIYIERFLFPERFEGSRFLS